MSEKLSIKVSDFVCLKNLYIHPLLLFFTAGFTKVFPMEKLHSFCPTELSTVLCGEQAPNWTKEDILTYTEPKLGYTKERYESSYLEHFIVWVTVIFVGGSALRQLDNQNRNSRKFKNTKFNGSKTPMVQKLTTN